MALQLSFNVCLSGYQMQKNCVFRGCCCLIFAAGLHTDFCVNSTRTLVNLSVHTLDGFNSIFNSVLCFLSFVLELWNCHMANEGPAFF